MGASLMKMAGKTLQFGMACGLVGSPVHSFSLHDWRGAGLKV